MIDRTKEQDSDSATQVQSIPVDLQPVKWWEKKSVPEMEEKKQVSQHEFQEEQTKQQAAHLQKIINPDEFKGLKWTARYHFCLFKKFLEKDDTKKEIFQLIEMIAQDHKANSEQIKIGLKQLDDLTREVTSKGTESKAHSLTGKLKIVDDVANIFHLFGLCHLFGVSFSKSRKSAFKNFEKAVKMGHFLSMGNLGEMLLDTKESFLHSGPDIADDLENAVNWISQAASLDNSHAQYLLGRLHTFGFSYRPIVAIWNLHRYKLVQVKIDKEMAFRLFTSSATQGNPCGQCELGKYLLFEGSKKAKRENKSLAWNLINCSKEQEFADAQYTMSLSYQKGLFSYKCNKEALNLCKKSLRDEKYLSLGLFNFSSPTKMKDYKELEKLQQDSEILENQVIKFFQSDLKKLLSRQVFGVISDYVDWDYDFKGKQKGLGR